MIKTIVVDLGGVYFEPGTRIALEKIYKIANVPKETADEIFEGHPKKEGWLYRKGKLTKEEYWKAAVKKLKIDERFIPRIQEIWHSSYRPVKGMRKIVAELRTNYRVIAFSGNIKERIDYLNERYGLSRDFDDFVFSYEAGFTKEEVESYKILLERVGCKPGECLFIDDMQEFLDMAKSFGMKTVLFRNPKQLKLELKRSGLWRPNYRRQRRLQP